MSDQAPRMTRRAAQVSRVLIGILVANLVVVVGKFAIGLATGSLSVLGDGVHATVDAMNNVLALIVIHIASQGPDDDHPYGHTKFETLGALAIVVFLSISGFELVKGAITRLLAGSAPLEVSNLHLGVLSGTLVINTIVAWYETKRGRELNSHLLLADAAHTRADVFITLGVLGAIMAARAGYGWADPVVAIVVAIVIVVVAWGIIARAVPVLVDQQAVPAGEIEQALESIPGITRVYDIRSRGTADQRFAELTIAVDPDASVQAAHDLADCVEHRLRHDLGFHEIVVHIEPC